MKLFDDVVGGSALWCASAFYPEFTAMANVSDGDLDVTAREEGWRNVGGLQEENGPISTGYGLQTPR